MTSRHELDQQRKINLVKGKERRLSHREIKTKSRCSLVLFQLSSKKKNEYVNDYETNQNKKWNERLKMILAKQTICNLFQPVSTTTGANLKLKSARNKLTSTIESVCSINYDLVNIWLLGSRQTTFIDWKEQTIEGLCARQKTIISAIKWSALDRNRIELLLWWYFEDVQRAHLIMQPLTNYI